MKRLAAMLAVLFSLLGMAMGDSGVLLPRDRETPDPTVLSLNEMEIRVVIDNGDAQVSVRQIFANHSDRIEEGTYIFALPSRATVSDFAVWDGPTRIPAVILERKRAGEIYAQAKQQIIDPGLLQMGERDSGEGKRNATFSAKIVPIPPYGTKRLELEYHETILVENLKSAFVIALKPDAYQAQVAGRLRIDFELRSTHDLASFQQTGSAYPLRLTQQNAHLVQGSFEGKNVSLAEDFVLQYELDGKRADTLDVIAYRNPKGARPDATETAPAPKQEEPGFFEARALLGTGKAANAGDAPARNLVVLFDNSLSMQWEKLERSYAAMEQILRSLRPADRFNLLLFNSKIEPFQPAPVAAIRSNVDKALDFVRASRLRGGTNLQQALDAGLRQFSGGPGGQPYLILLSDGGATVGAIQNGRLSKEYAAQWRQLPEASRPRTYVFAVGDDANLPLLRLIARQDGFLENVLSTEPVEFKLNSFLSKIGRKPVGDLGLGVTPNDAVQMVYPLQDSAFSGSMVSWVGQYRRPAKASFTLHAMREGAPVDLRTQATLPAEALEHPQLPRLWAKARVDALLEKINRDGEDAKSIEEIIRLSRKYKFVTPYTSFLAVPRALLRPRVIRPGDPILRVHTDAAIHSVIAIFPFGLTKRLRYLTGEDVWQTRFLAPDDMQDGTYTVRLILRDKDGNLYRETKSFVIASKPPAVTVRLDSRRYRRGETIRLKVSSSASTRTLMARLEGAAPVPLHWDQRAGVSTGELPVPADLPAGNYRLTVIAEDIAHNIGTQEVRIEVLP